MPRFLPVGKDAKGAAGFLLAALPALGALLTALAITGDLVGRMARNHPWATFGAFGCAASAVLRRCRIRGTSHKIRAPSAMQRRTSQITRVCRVAKMKSIETVLELRITSNSA